MRRSRLLSASTEVPVPAPGEVARVGELWRYPIKAMRGERLDAARFEPDGVRGDRLLRVEVDGRLTTARTRRELLRLAASIGRDGEPSIGGERWDGEPARAALEDAAPGARLVRTDVGARFDELPVLLLGAATAYELGADPRRLRPTVLIEGLLPREEEAWVGSRIEVGPVALDVEHRCKRCVVTTIDPDDLSVDPSVLERINADFDGRMGVVCTVARTGTVQVGDLLRAPGAGVACAE